MLAVRLCGVDPVSTADKADRDDRCLTCFPGLVFGVDVPAASLVKEGDLASPRPPRIEDGLRNVGVAGVPGVGGARPVPGVAGVLRPAVLLVLGRGREERTFGFGLGSPVVTCPGELGECPGERDEGLMVVARRSSLSDPLMRVMCEFCVVKWVIERRVHDARNSNTCAARSTSDAPTAGQTQETTSLGPPHPVTYASYITSIRPSQ